MENFNTHFTVTDRNLFEAKMLNWLKRFNIFCYLNNCGFSEPDAFTCLVAAGVEKEIFLNSRDEPFKKLQHFHEMHPAWLFGHISYELNTGIHNNKKATVQFPEGYFFVPEILFSLSGNEVKFIKCADASKVFNEIMNTTTEVPPPARTSPIRSRISKGEYIEALEHVKKHIKKGDCYELNFCQEFYAKSEEIASTLYSKLIKESPQPFSAFYRHHNSYCCCASPERFLKKEGRKLISQPIKGTAPRGFDEASDRANFQSLQNSSKDRSENVMVVDLVRNDLSRVCRPGSVRVPNLFAVRTFPGVHQMISTVTGQMEEEFSFADALEAAFPMGSMTGAPKIRVMQLIENYEAGARGLFSGSIGYISPDGDFDFNVVIRSLFLNERSGELSFIAGGGITHYSNAEAEYEESMLKTVAIRRILEG